MQAVSRRFAALGRSRACARRSSRRTRRVPAGSAPSRPTCERRCSAPGIEGADLVAVVHEPSSPQRRGVLATIAQAVRGDYVRTARMLGRLDVDVVLLQHEYGIFGGRDGEYVLSFAQELAQPLVVTLHTVLSEPTPHQARGTDGAVRRGGARDRDDGHGAAVARRVGRLPGGEGARRAARRAGAYHGARAASALRARQSASPAVDDAFRLSTFGLISPGKGLETVIDALPAMIERHPEIVYTIAGRTHPDVSRREGERYRLMLERRVLELGLGDHVEFDDRFLVDRRALGPARRNRRLRDAVRKPGADRLRRAHVRDRCRLRRRLDALLVRAGHARFGRRAARAVRRSGSARRRGLQLRRAAGHARRLRAPRPGGSARRSRGRPSQRPPLPSCRKPTSSRRGDGPPASRTCT